MILCSGHGNARFGTAGERHGSSKDKLEWTSKTVADNAQRLGIDKLVRLLKDRRDCKSPFLLALREDFFAERPEAHQAEQ